ncbi:MAG TPA: hypothetical protein VMD99_08155 [Terriglobales bacterium]|nr:hypothetical protein [Terriglobales bacterium]
MQNNVRRKITIISGVAEKCCKKVRAHRRKFAKYCNSSAHDEEVLEAKDLTSQVLKLEKVEVVND